MLTLTLACYSKHSPVDDLTLICAWRNGADFKIASGPYCSNRDEHYLVQKFGPEFHLVANNENGWIEAMYTANT